MVTTPERWRALSNASLNDPLINSVNPDIIQLSNGDILVGWTSGSNAGVGSPAGLDIIGARYDWQGSIQPGELRLNAGHFDHNEAEGKLAAVPNGDFLSVYVDRTATGSTLYLDRFNLDGSADGGTVIDSAAIAGFHGPFDVAATSDTNAVIFYVQNDNETGTQDVLYSRSYDPSTGAVGGKNFVIQNGTFGSDFLSIEATALTGGGYAIALHVDDPAGDDEIWVARTSSNGTYLNYVRIPATTGNAGADSEPTITALSDGGFVVAWTTPIGAIRHQRFDSNGSLVGATATLSVAGNTLNEPAITGLADGGYVIVTTNDTTGRLVAYHFSSTGSQLGEGHVLAAGAAIHQPDARTLADGRVVVSWYDATAGAVRTSIIDTRDQAAAGYLTPTDVHVGTVRDDIFTASAGSAVNGWRGNDRITDGSGGETIRGGTGNDTIIAVGVSADDVFQGDSGTDTLILTDVGNGTIYNGAASTLTSGAIIQSVSNFEIVRGSAADEILLGRASLDILSGGGGNDRIEGRDGADTLHGDNGNDTLLGGTGGDIMTGGAGNDLLLGEGGNDFALGGDGADQMHGGVGDDTLRGDGGDDFISGGNGYDLIRGGDGNDSLNGDLYGDRLLGERGDDTLNGGEQNDTLEGGEGNDLLLGSYNHDLLKGGPNDDILIGGNGQDTLYGNLGADRFVFADDRSADVVKDWQNGVDVIDFSASAQIEDFADFLAAASQTSNGVLVRMADGTSILFEKSVLAQFDASDFVF